jgi:hypoxanthine phosphoribosyltransferase
MISTFSRAVLATIEREKLLPRRSKVVVGLSGGSDSVALLSALRELGPELDLALIATHVDHRLRPSSGDDAAFCEKLAREWSVPFRLVTITWPDTGGRPRANIEAAARRARYDALSRIAREAGRAIVAVGHHADDRLETFLIQLVRGSGLTGLSQPRYRREDGVVRPLLDRTRREILEYLAAGSIPFRVDPTNLDGSNLRSRIRTQVVPLLEQENPELARVVARTASLLAQADAALSTLASEARRQLTRSEGSGELTLDGAGAHAYHPIILSTLLRNILGEFGGSAVEVGHEPIARIVRAWRGQETLALDLPGRIRVELDGESAHILSLGAGSEHRAPRPEEIPIPGELTWNRAGPGPSVRIRTEVVEPTPVDPACLSGPTVAWIDAGRVRRPLTVRGRLPGDRYHPLGLSGSAKIQDLFVDRKIAREAREAWPVIADKEGILWVPGFRVDERVRITEETRSALRMEVTGVAEPTPEASAAMTRETTISPVVGTPLLSKEAIGRRVLELGKELSRVYADENPVLVNILKGGFIFLADLVRAMNVRCELDFMVVSSYEDKTDSSGVVRILSDLGVNIAGRHVLIVEDIVDTGLTLEYIRELLLSRNPKSLRIVTLLDKAQKRKVSVPIDFVGFEIPDEFVVGYGLDYAQRYRNLPYITVLGPEEIASGQGHLSPENLAR